MASSCGRTLRTVLVSKDVVTVMGRRSFSAGGKAKKGSKGGAGSDVDVPKASTLTKEIKANTVVGANILKDGTDPKIIEDHNNNHHNYKSLTSLRTYEEVKRIYESWLVENKKIYNALGEKETRFKIFRDNLRYIDEHNAQDHTYKLGLNKFADLTIEEIKRLYCGVLG